MPFLLCLIFVERIWQALVLFRMTSFILALIGLAIVLLVGPIFSIVGGLLALHFRIEAGFASPNGKLGLTDKFFLLTGFLASLIPSLAVFFLAFHVGKVRHGLLIRGGSLGLALIFALLAGAYWKNRFKRKEPRQDR